MSLHLAGSLSSLPASVFSSQRASLLIGTDSRVSVFSCEDCDSSALTTLPKVTEQSGELSDDGSFRPKSTSKGSRTHCEQESVYLLEEKLAQKDQIVLEMTKLQASLYAQVKEQRSEIEKLQGANGQLPAKVREEAESLKSENQRLMGELKRLRGENEANVKRFLTEKEFLVGEIAAKNKRIGELESEASKYSQKTTNLELRLQETTQRLSRSRAKESEYKSKQKALTSVMEENRLLGGKMEELKRLLVTKTRNDSEVQSFEKDLKVKEGVIQTLEREVETLRAEVAARPNNAEVAIYLKRIEELEKCSARHHHKPRSDRPPVDESYFKVYQKIANLMVACCPPSALPHSPTPKTVWKWVRAIAEELLAVRTHRPNLRYPL